MNGVGISTGLDIERYNALRGTKLFTITPLKPPLLMQADDGSKTFKFTFTQYDQYTGAQSEVSVEVNHFELLKQRQQIAQQLTQGQAILQLLDNILKDLNDAVVVVEETKG